MRQGIPGVAFWQSSESQDVVWLETWPLLPPKTSHKRGSFFGHVVSVLSSGQNTPNCNLTAHKPIPSCASKCAVSTESEAISKADAERISRQCQGKE